jgi:hypothetical protein
VGTDENDTIGAQQLERQTPVSCSPEGRQEEASSAADHHGLARHGDIGEPGIREQCLQEKRRADDEAELLSENEAGADTQLGIAVTQIETEDERRGGDGQARYAILILEVEPDVGGIFLPGDGTLNGERQEVGKQDQNDF